MHPRKYKVGMLLQGQYCKDNYYLVVKVERSDDSRSNKITIKGFTHNSCSDIQVEEELADEAYTVLGDFGSDIFTKGNLRNCTEDILKASQAVDNLGLTPIERIFSLMYLTIHSSLKESFDKDLEKAKEDIRKEYEEKERKFTCL